jgi:hypothetical protein
MRLELRGHFHIWQKCLALHAKGNVFLLPISPHAHQLLVPNAFAAHLAQLNGDCMSGVTAPHHEPRPNHSCAVSHERGNLLPAQSHMDKPNHIRIHTSSTYAQNAIANNA